jgi:hypothetical protein
VTHYLHETTLPKIVQVVQRCAITSQMAELFAREDGLVSLLRTDRMDDLNRAYRLVTPRDVTGGVKLVCEILTDHITKHGKELLKAEKEPIPYVDSLLELKRKYDKIVEVAFDSDRVFTAAMNDCLDTVLNCDMGTPKLLVEYVDALLKKGGMPNPPQVSHKPARCPRVCTTHCR